MTVVNGYSCPCGCALLAPTPCGSKPCASVTACNDLHGKRGGKNGKESGFRYLAQENRNRLMFRHLQGHGFMGNGKERGFRYLDQEKENRLVCRLRARARFLRRRLFAHAERLHLQRKREELKVPCSH